VMQMKFVSAREGPPNAGSKIYTVHYLDENGNITIRSEGTKAWRNNNPGNMRYRGGFACRHGAIGSAGGMAVFPNEAVGKQALVSLLKSSNYNTLKIKDLSQKYDKDNAQEYRRMLLSISKLDPNRCIKDLSEKEFDKLREAIERIEGWEIGLEDFIEKYYISGVHKTRGVIVKYLVVRNGESTWIAKNTALQLACDGKLHAVIVHLKNGTTYLRPEYNAHPFTQVA
jgi:hypothetical protein